MGAGVGGAQRRLTCPTLLSTAATRDLERSWGDMAGDRGVSALTGDLFGQWGYPGRGEGRSQPLGPCKSSDTLERTRK